MGLLVFIATITLCLVASSASLQRFNKPPKKDGSLSFLVIGDWGRNGAHHQTEVANQMGIVGEKLDIDFVISTGDNFYNYGLKDINDQAFYTSFTKIYNATSLQKQWYSVLGNHDYLGNVEAQLSPVLSQRDKRWLCLRSYIVNAEVAEFFFVDTNPFVDIYFTKPKGKTYDWRGVLPRTEYISNLLKDVDLALKQSRAKWKIVVGHHAIKSAGEHGVTKEVEKQLLPILEKHNVDVYMNGHDHCLQHISSKIQFLTSGGGSKAWNGVFRKWDLRELKLYYDGQGFMSVQITKTKLDIAFYNIFGEVLHKWNKSK